MNILDKFNQVEIKNDTRISESDLNFCKKQQRLYENILNNYTCVFNRLIDVKKLQNELEDNISEENTYFKNGDKYNYYQHIFVSVGNREIAETIYSVHKHFISIIVDYFKGKYGVALEQEFDKIIKLEEPKKNDSYSYYGYRSLTDEEIEKIKKENEEFDRKEEQYFLDIIGYRVSYNGILDNIFIQLDGYSFTDKVKKEIIDACVKSCEGYRNKNAEIKNNRIAFTNIVYSHFDSIWKRYEISLNSSDYINILRALSFFDSDENVKEIYDIWYHDFVKYSSDEEKGIYDTFEVHGNKVDAFKFFKNGKWEVKFKSQIFAEEFAKAYCGLEI